ncbi:hypothetical protein D3C72_1745050 [compost metagenome]
MTGPASASFAAMGAGTPWTRVCPTDNAPSPHCAGRKFMPGEPMKWPTKVCAGRSNRSSALPT